MGLDVTGIAEVYRTSAISLNGFLGSDYCGAPPFAPRFGRDDGQSVPESRPEYVPKVSFLLRILSSLFQELLREASPSLERT